MLFPKRTDYTKTISSITLGSTQTFELTREFAIESLVLKIVVTTSAVMATANADGLARLLKRVQLQIADGSRTRNVVDVEGPSLLEYHRHAVGAVDSSTATAYVANGTTTYTLFYPLHCAHPQIADPIGSTLLLPVYRYNNNPVLTLQFANQAEMDQNATPTFAISACTASVIVNRRDTTGVRDFRTFDWELAELSQNYPTTGNAQLYELQVPGSYTGLLMKAYTGATAAQARGDISNGEFRLQALGNVLRRFRLADLEAENQWSMFRPTTPTINGSYYLDFLTDRAGEGVAELGSVLDANVIAQTGARLQLLQDLTGNTAAKINYVTHRIFGVLDDLKLAKTK